MFSLTILYSVAVFAGILFLVKLRFRSKGKLPPGPKRLPIVGNITDLPPPGKAEYLHWLTFKDKYGPISSVTVMGQTIVILHDHELAVELLEKRANIYSARPQSFFAAQVCDMKDWLGFQNYTPLLKSYRKDIHSVVGSTASLRRAMPMSEDEVSKFLVRTAKDPDNWLTNEINLFASLVLNIGYGYRIEPEGRDPLVDLSYKAMEYFGDAVVAGKWMVDIFNWLQYVPEWMPGAGFKKLAKVYNKAMEDSATVPMRFTEEKLDQGTSTECLMADLLAAVDRKNLSESDYNRIRRSVGGLFLGGSDTTSATISWFFALMVKYPDVQRKAQDEIDRVIGIERLPSFDDRPNLPYVEAVWKECLRWHTIGPLGLPHAVTEDDWVKGYFIPKGSMIIANTWWFLRDPKTYRYPDVFNPERFLGEHPEPDPEKSGNFGYGRRICPGKGLADQGGWMFIAKVLSVFDMVAKGDARGQFQMPEPKPGIVTHPKHFDVTIKPRGEQHAERIADLEKRLAWQSEDGEAIRRIQRELATSEAKS